LPRSTASAGRRSSVTAWWPAN